MKSVLNQRAVYPCSSLTRWTTLEGRINNVFCHTHARTLGVVLHGPSRHCLSVDLPFGTWLALDISLAPCSAHHQNTYTPTLQYGRSIARCRSAPFKKENRAKRKYTSPDITVACCSAHQAVSCATAFWRRCCGLAWGGGAAFPTYSERDQRPLILDTKTSLSSQSRSWTMPCRQG
ncbi:hypothetical protein LX32DRAFT_263334 [Colletotrichum zoysiae]|uniref:Uncharacterized protein n=1 Tax=Colletotrichum zoysiae TaxID=1216348 RepID=A0AAD9HMM1_9PEZI|nr:hypothetical protein LX32DRAFT_263334 [Colletotrichum zoysiae]